MRWGLLIIREKGVSKKKSLPVLFLSVLAHREREWHTILIFYRTNMLDEPRTSQIELRELIVLHNND